MQQAIAIINGQPYLEIPQDLYIPPDALRVFLEAFEGPLDLLLYLIKKQNIDILDIPIAEVTKQYIAYVDMMKNMNLELAAEYLVMAAFLAEVKSRLLLPKQTSAGPEESDPRAELVRRLQEYEQFKKAAVELDHLPRVEREIFLIQPVFCQLQPVKVLPQVELKDLLIALTDVMRNAKLKQHHQIKMESLSIRERMTHILDKITSDKFRVFSDFFSLEEGRIGVVVTFIAILELIRQSLIEIVQSKPYAPIHLRAATSL